VVRGGGSCGTLVQVVVVMLSARESTKAVLPLRQRPWGCAINVWLPIFLKGQVMVSTRRQTRSRVALALLATALTGCSTVGFEKPYSAAAPARPAGGGLAMPGLSALRMPRVNAPFFNNGEIMPLPEPPRGGANSSFNGGFPNIPYANWSEDEPDYRLYPGDELEVVVPSAPELSKTLTVQPDGRVSLPLLQPIMAADRSLPDLQATLTQAYSSQLLRPTVNLALKSTTPLKVFVGGEVTNPGVYDMTGDGDALRAIFQAGGFKATGNRTQVAVIRRGIDGLPMMRTADLSGGLRGHGDSRPTDLVPLRRFDIVYVPKTRAAEASQWVQTYFRDLSPIQLGFSYAIPFN
jgi:protein involved in polysaccharide export with SLBB domain